jgi:methanogenic corrinoid protein MtbC1
LYEIGQLWKNGQLTVAQEHLFAEFAEQVIHRFKERSLPMPNFPQVKNVDVLLVCAEGNYHTLGVQIIDLARSELGLKTKTITPGLPNQDILWSIDRFQPRLLGISIAEQEQKGAGLEIVKLIQEDPSRVDMKILVGGSGI